MLINEPGAYSRTAVVKRREREAVSCWTVGLIGVGGVGGEGWGLMGSLRRASSLPRASCFKYFCLDMPELSRKGQETRKSPCLCP